MNSKLKQDAEVIYDYLARRVGKLESNLLDACRRTDETGALGTLAELMDASYVKRVTKSVVTELPAEPVVPTYMISSLTLQEACSVLTKTEDEDLRFGTGLIVAPKTYAITRLLPFELKRRSVVCAEGEQEAVARLLIGLHNADHKLFLTVHSHPGTGEASVKPSSVDLDFHRRLEAGNYPAIGVIVNRENFVKFYSYKQQFKISVYGKVEVINEQSNVFKLSKIGSV